MRQQLKQMLCALGYLLGVHVMALVVTGFFRIVELVALHGLIVQNDASPLVALLKGLWFDNVIVCYVQLLPVVLLLLAVGQGWCRRWLLRSLTCWYGAILCVAFIPSAANIPYFQYFFKNINSSIFGWFGYVGTTAGMLLQESSYWLYMALYVVMATAFVYGLVRLERRVRPLLCRPADEGRRTLAQRACGVALTLLVGALCLFGIRGRLGYNPIKVSQAYYCDDAFLNQLGINPAFNLLTSVLDDLRKENRELHLMPYPEAVANTRRWLGITGPADSTCVLRRYVVGDSVATARMAMACGSMRRKPNVVVILMESMSARLMDTFGHGRHLTPTLDSLYRHSLAFTHFYSAGIHTNHGMTATLYSFPALMFRNLMKGTVTPHRQGIATVLKRQGYSNAFFMTHEAQYDNMKAFFSTNGYDDIYSQESYPKSEVVNSFGVSDHFLFQYALQRLNEKARTGRPLMATLLTISNHPPYVIPSWFHARSKEKEDQIVEYADWCVGDFLRRASREPWYDNTIFVIQADHGKLVGQSEGELPESYNHIPLIIFGPGVPQMQYDGLGTQVDVMPTLLGLMGVSYSYEGFGMDLLRTRRPMVFYSADNQIVARDRHRCFIYNPSMRQSFCYDVAEDGTIREAHDTQRFADLKTYVFSNIQTAEYIERHRQ